MICVDLTKQCFLQMDALAMFAQANLTHDTVGKTLEMSTQTEMTGSKIIALYDTIEDTTTSSSQTDVYVYSEMQLNNN